MAKDSRGSQNGVSNNPHGRPAGSKNRASTDIKERIERIVAGKIDSVMEEVDLLEPKDRVKFFLELLKLTVPRPVSAEELDAISQSSRSALVARLFFDRED
jgi:hypothetical protein